MFSSYAILQIEKISANLTAVCRNMVCVVGVSGFLNFWLLGEGPLSSGGELVRMAYLGLGFL